MRCKRCQGLIVMECSADTECSAVLAGVNAMRCVNCGAREYARGDQNSGGFTVPNPHVVSRGRGVENRATRSLT